jgi:sulfite oxidase
MTPSVDKHPDFIVRQQEPFNGGPPPSRICQDVIIPNDLFFVRNHTSVPEVDPASYRLVVDGRVRQPLSLSLDDLRAFPFHEATTTLQCAGNRRREMEGVATIPDEIIWDTEAVSTAVWGGALLRDVLNAAGVNGGEHCAFEGLDQVEHEGEAECFGGSIPLEKALRQEVLLAYTMNGVPLPRLHGYPVRAVVPGYIGARSVKWLARITMQNEPSANYYQTHAYKLFPAHVGKESVDWSQGMMLGELPLNTLICYPEEGAAVPAGVVTLRGHALAGERRVERVEVSGDGGKTWVTARLLSEAIPWTWVLWEAALMLSPGAVELVARAWDSAAQTQPEQVGSIWNFKGYMNNAYHRINVQVRA